MIKDIKGIQDFELTEEKLKPLAVVRQNVNNKYLTFDSSMTAAEINNIITNTEHEVNLDKSLFLNFIPGTYNFTEPIWITGFRGRGFIHIYGEDTSADKGLRTDQATVINTRAIFMNNVFIIQANSVVNIILANMKFLFNSSNTSQCLYIANNKADITILSSYIQGTNRNYGAKCVNVRDSKCSIRNTYVSSTNYGLFADTAGLIDSYNVDDDTPEPKYGLLANGTGKICKIGGIQPSGELADEYEAWGGIIR